MRPVVDAPSAPYSDLQSEIRVERGDLLERYVAAQRRLLTVAGPILTANAALCPRRAYSPGFSVFSDFDMPDQLRDVAYERMMLNRDAMVKAVIPGSDAWHAGVRTGDILLTMNDARVRNAADARAKLRRRKAGGDMDFGFVRKGRSYEVSLPFKAICNYPLVYLEGDRDINAYATGKQIVVTQGMVDFTSDSELAAIIGHELAHNIMHHIPKGIVNTSGIVVAGAVIDGILNVAGLGSNITEVMMQMYTQAFSASFEKEADYVGLYLVARGGGDYTAAAGIWRKIAAEHGSERLLHPAHMVRTHPDTPERFVVMRRTADEIALKIRKGEALMPNLDHGFAYGRKFWPWEGAADEDEEPDDADLNH